MKTKLTLCLILFAAQTGFAQSNNSRIAAGSGMPSRISMNVTVPKQQHRTAAADSTRNPLYEQGGTSGENPLFEGIIQPAQHKGNQPKNRKNPIKRAPAEKRHSGLRDVVKTQV
ncbi:hypothetical protein [Niabella aurantiaca]|uniref:hypothetical protein n=1 Tax=Niabella aurantiaca TaxID=379900 RepID=UPI000370BA63|nr:hypothetical protein [Niabella aurantiaca]